MQRRTTPAFLNLCFVRSSPSGLAPPHYPVLRHRIAASSVALVRETLVAISSIARPVVRRRLGDGHRTTRCRPITCPNTPSHRPALPPVRPEDRGPPMTSLFPLVPLSNPSPPLFLSTPDAAEPQMQGSRRCCCCCCAVQAPPLPKQRAGA
ncbi:hypothetical protein IWX90DRAFT_188399 [Phyllosticta citrichinensis]|uniref:Uncharacterized protein n=1 Tax=Phyllosticta citrichinensis TaxID=1130410 RepID=A0ABR1XWX0_9PEZI